MDDPHLLALLGATAPEGMSPDPRLILSALAADPSAMTTFRAPVLPPDDTWLHLSALPTESSSAGPFDTVFGASSGGLAEFTVVLNHSDTAGLRLFVSPGHPAIVERTRNQLAPHCDVTAGAPPKDAVSGVGLGLRYRLQAELGRPSAGERGRGGVVIERLATVAGTWSAVFSFRSVHQQEVREAQEHVGILNRLAAENLTSTRQEAAARSSTTVSADWARVQAWLAVIMDQLAQGGSGGLWKAAAWAYGADEWIARQVVAALRGAIPEDDGRRFMAYDAAMAGPSDPLSVLTTSEIAAILAPPAASIPGLAVRPAPPSARRPDSSGSHIVLGEYWSTEIPATIGVTDFEGHAFVTGTTGSGKTTTLHRILAEAWNRHRIPFLVIDPVKDDYSVASGLFQGGLTTVTGSELSFNLMAAWPGEGAREHVSQVAQAFRGAFTMPSPTPYVVTQLFDQIAMQPGGPAGTELFDVRDALDDLVASLGYAAEARSNIRASLLTRLNMLLAPTRAHRFAWPDSAMIDSLFDKPTVVTLSDLVDDEERSFLVLLLALATWARARTRTSPAAVEHLLVLEEAHRVLPEVQESLSAESGSASSASAHLLTSMLAEVRSYGEQVIVVDQSPAKVAADVVRNTNLKIVHRTVSADDQRTVAAALGIAESEAGLLGSLARGQAIVSTRQETSPQTVSIVAAERHAAFSSPATASRTQPAWPCCGGDAPERHFRAWRWAEEGEAAMAMFLLGCRVGTEEVADDAREKTVALLRTHESARGVRVDCLAWAGLRRLLIAERSAGLLPSALAVAGQLSSLYAVWADGAGPSTRASTQFSVPRSGAASICPYCAVACRVRVPAWVEVQNGPRTGLLALASSGWRSELGSVAEWAKGERGRLAALLGERGADILLTCQIHQAVSRFRVGRSTADLLLSRAGLLTA